MCNKIERERERKREKKRERQEEKERQRETQRDRETEKCCCPFDFSLIIVRRPRIAEKLP